MLSERCLCCVWPIESALVVHWNDKSMCDTDALALILEHESIKGDIQDSASDSITLHDCFAMFAKPDVRTTSIRSSYPVTITALSVCLSDWFVLC